MLRSLAKIVLCCTPVLFALNGCKTNNIQSETNNNVYEQTIDEDGGMVGSRKTFGAFIPFGAIDAPVNFKVSEAEPGDYPPPPNDIVGKVYSFEPHGTEFNTKVTIYLPAAAGSIGYRMLHAEPGGDWAQLPDPVNSNATMVESTT
jgi:hypothetical protein